MDSLLSEPGQTPGGTASPVTGQPTAAELYGAIHTHLRAVGQAVKSTSPPSVEPLNSLLTQIVDTFRENDSLLIRALIPEDTSRDLALHMTNVCIFAIKVGIGLGLPAADLRRLALAAALHDVGMWKVPEEILRKPGSLSPAEWEVVRKHPEESMTLLRSLGSEYGWLASIAHQEHEREHGRGYPRGLIGENIHEYAKIIGIADTYEALTHSRPHRKHLVPFDAVKEIISSERQAFSDRILKGLIQGLSTFPVGSIVLLSSHEVARVVSANTVFPLRPVVEVIKSATGERATPPRRMDLSASSLLYIVDATAEDGDTGK